MRERGCAQVGRCRIKILLEGQLVAKNFILSISDDYPESYWLKIKMLSGEDSGVFKEGVAVSKDLKICFEGSKRVSTSKLLGYDFLYSDGPNDFATTLRINEGRKYFWCSVCGCGSTDR